MSKRTEQVKISLTPEEHADLTTHAGRIPVGIAARALVLDGLLYERARSNARETFLADSDDPGIL